MVLLGSCRKTLEKIIIELLVGFCVSELFSAKAVAHLILRCYHAGPRPPRHTKGQRATTLTQSINTKQAIPKCVHRCTLIFWGVWGLFFPSQMGPSAPDLVFNKGFHGPHTDENFVGGLLWTLTAFWGDSSKSHHCPLFLGAPLRKYSPSLSAPDSPSYSFVCSKKISTDLFFSFPTPVLVSINILKNNSGRFFWSDITLRAPFISNQHSLFPIPNKTTISKKPKMSRTHRVASKGHWTPNFHPPWSRKKIVVGMMGPALISQDDQHRSCLDCIPARWLVL